MYALELVGIGKQYGLFTPRDALRGVTLRVGPGECYGLAGPNGAGKTTLIKILLGLLLPDAGEARLLGHRPDDPEVRRRVGFVPESAELPPAASPRALIGRFARLRGLPIGPAKEQGVALLERLGMQELLDRPCGKLSKGERQRTLLSLALLGSPELLILDEPTDGLDPIGRTLVRRVIREEVDAGRTVFINSHLLAETERMCTRVGILHRGRLVREERIEAAPQARAGGRTAIVLGAPLAPEVQAQLGYGEGPLVVQHADLAELNVAVDRLRGAGALLAELRPLRDDLETAYTRALNEPAPEPGAPADETPAAPAPAPRFAPFRGLVGSARVAAEIAADLASRRIGWIALAAAVLAVGAGLWIIRSESIQGMAALARSFGRRGGTVTPEDVGAIIGRSVAGAGFWLALAGSLGTSALFAPPILEPRRAILLLAQPIARTDLASGILVAVSAVAAAVQVFLLALLWAGLRFLELPVPATFLLVPITIFTGFVALYGGVLLATYLTRNVLVAAIVAVASVMGVAILGNSSVARPGAAVGFWGFVYGLAPKIGALGDQAMRLGGGGRATLTPYLSTLVYAAAVLLFVHLAARRSER